MPLPPTNKKLIRVVCNWVSRSNQTDWLRKVIDMSPAVEGFKGCINVIDNSSHISMLYIDCPSDSQELGHKLIIKIIK